MSSWQEERMLKFFGPVAGAILLAGLISAGSSPARTTYACSGAYPSFDDVAIGADAIAIVRVTQIGGPDYSIPPLTPTVIPTATAPSGGSPGGVMQTITAPATANPRP